MLPYLRGGISERPVNRLPQYGEARAERWGLPCVSMRPVNGTPARRVVQRLASGIRGFFFGARTRRAAFLVALLPSLSFGQLLTMGPSARTLGPDRTNHETSTYRVGSFGWFGISITERHGEFYYPTSTDYHPAGVLATDLGDVARGDFNGDGREDWVATFPLFPHTVPRQSQQPIVVFLNDGKGGFRAAPEIWATGAPPIRRYHQVRLTVADFNRDGRSDFVVACEGLNQRNPDGTLTQRFDPLVLALSGPDGKLTDGTANIAGQENGGTIPGLSVGHEICAGDLNGDGAPDIYTGGTVLLNDGTGKFTNGSAQMPDDVRNFRAQIMSSAIADLNGDGIGDLVAAYFDGAPNGESGYVWLSQNGAKSLAGRKLVRLPAGRYGAGTTKFNECRLVDVTGDGRPDIVFAVTRATPYYRGRTLQVLVNQGGETFVDETAVRVVAPAALDQEFGQSIMAVVDVNRDGILDVAQTGGRVLDDKAKNSTTVYLGGADGVLRAQDWAVLPWVQPWQLTGYAMTKGFVDRALSVALPMDIDGAGQLDFVAWVDTPFTQWPQVEPTEATLYSILSKEAEPARPASALYNLSIRTGTGSGLIVGFVVAGGSRDVLMRGIGPSLAQFGVPGTIADPKLDVYQDAGRIAANDDWGASGVLGRDFTNAGAFPLAAGTRDAALRLAVRGGRTIQVAGANGGSGIALVELYDLGSGRGRLVNVSTRAQVGTGADVLVAGFSVVGTASKRLLIRAVGPSLGAFGVTGTLADPVVEVRALGANAVTAANDNWGGTAALKTTFASVGAFALAGDASADAVVIVDVPPGSYTATVSGKNGTTGVALVEIYDLP